MTGLQPREKLVFKEIEYMNNCIKHGGFEGTVCLVCLDLEIAQELKWASEVDLYEDLEDTEEVCIARESVGE